MDPRVEELRIRSWELHPRVTALLSATKIETVEGVYKSLAPYKYGKAVIHLIEDLFPEETFIWRLEQ